MVVRSLIEKGLDVRPSCWQYWNRQNLSVILRSDILGQGFGAKHISRWILLCAAEEGEKHGLS